MSLRLHPLLGLFWLAAILAKAWCVGSLAPRPELPRFLFWFVACSLIWSIVLIWLSALGDGETYRQAFWVGGFVVDGLAGAVVAGCLMEGK